MHVNDDNDKDDNTSIQRDNTIILIKESEVIQTNQTIKDNTDNRNKLNYVDATPSPTLDDNNLTINTIISSQTNTSNENIVTNVNNLNDDKLLDKRLKAWEKNSMDYLGLDSFDNIQAKLNQAIGLKNLPHLINRDKQSANQQSSTKLSKLSTPCNSLDLSVGKLIQISLSIYFHSQIYNSTNLLTF